MVALTASRSNSATKQSIINQNMAKKKRTRTATTAAATDGDTNNGCNDGNRSGSLLLEFKSFPLHLISPERPVVLDDAVVGDYEPNSSSSSPLSKSISTLTELCKGRVWVVPSFFTVHECQSWIDFCESTSTLQSSYRLSRATSYTAHRECYRLQQPDAMTLASRVFNRLQSTRISCMDNSSNRQKKYNLTTKINGGGDGIESLLDRLIAETEDIYGGGGGCRDSFRPVGCNPNFRVYKYTRGHSFGKHIDESNDVPALRGKTGMTILIYLSECQGGATRFYTNHHDDSEKSEGGSGSKSQRRQKTASNNKKSGSIDCLSSSSSSFAFQPCVGSMLLHVHGEQCLEHEAEPVLGGNKYVLRTDLVFG